ncbi:acyl-CoA reductase-like NAD-dependent aldehyde dehydrogenase [Solirubrobacter pauli]|uniref:Acyl-CoA reductase-like NAD-dependent aldehyde dehydrogenase n=1 Tax=Solirubrobacter pauli TaxID=166793 RepID=A0A660L809_9ACTN|nr:aldehyde dehydrogenase family protein [Solirubrobacter pauli]RKQ91162.1 acyl-CoA reductase-like NAD-dependent aldehyde dehydrogenase [Solirubrobacter pauli]
MTTLASPPETLDVLDPSTGEPIATVEIGDADAAVRAARAAAPAWARTAAAERAERLKAGARRLREHVDQLAELQSREGGKPLADSRGGIEAGIGAIEQYAELGPLHRGKALQGGWNATDVMVHEPRGVVALLVPWNDPVAIACGQIAAALVAGNAVVFKPSEKTPLSGARIVELLDIPGGALQLLQGDARVGRPLAAHPDVDLVMHTGSVQTGREIADVVAGRMGKALLELGGKDALIVDADVDPAWAAEQAALGAYANAGQICTSVERIYVHEAVAEPFVEALARAADGWTIGPLIDARQREVVHAHVTDAVERGARLVRGGAVPDGPGFFYPPTVLVGGDRDAPVLREETFGPVAAVQVVTSFDEALALADDTEYGLAATVLTKNPEHAQRAVRELAVGTVKINAVFGGAPGGAAEPARLSGSGFGYGPELLDELTRTKVVHMGIAP